MPLTRPDEERIAGGNAVSLLACFEFTGSRDIQCETEFRQRPSVLPFEIKNRRVALRIRLAGLHALPAGVRQIKSLVKKRFVHGQRMPERFGQAHLLD